MLHFHKFHVYDYSQSELLLHCMYIGMRETKPLYIHLLSVSCDIWKLSGAEYLIHKPAFGKSGIYAVYILIGTLTG